MLSNLTVRETVRTSAELKLPVGMPSEEKAVRVAELLRILGLCKVSAATICWRGAIWGGRGRDHVLAET
jgi:hypothetical protein